MYPAQCALRSEGATPRCLKVIHYDASEMKSGIDCIASMSSRKGTWPQPGMTLISDFCKFEEMYLIVLIVREAGHYFWASLSLAASQNHLKRAIAAQRDPVWQLNRQRTY